jgi:hypothetical protein
MRAFALITLTAGILATWPSRLRVLRSSRASRSASRAKRSRIGGLGSAEQGLSSSALFLTK